MTLWAVNYELTTILMLQRKPYVSQNNLATLYQEGKPRRLNVLYTPFTEKYSCVLKDEQGQNLLSCRDWNRQSK